MDHKEKQENSEREKSIQFKEGTTLSPPRGGSPFPNGQAASPFLQLDKNMNTFFLAHFP